MPRIDGRRPKELRPVTFDINAQPYAEGSVIIETGQTRVLCSVSAEQGVPSFLKESGRGWITAEYSMLPRSTVTRTQRETRTGPRGRTQEIQRLIGRSLRAAVNLEDMGELTLTVDCDVLQADGGTRTAAITGAYVALNLAFTTLVEQNILDRIPIKYAVAATSVGIVDGEILLDLNYEEDYQADVDFNVVMTDNDRFVEIQGAAEGSSFSKPAFDQVLSTAEAGIKQLLDFQVEATQSTNAIYPCERK